MLSNSSPPFQFKNYWRSGIALGLSLLLHALLLSGLDWHCPLPDHEPSLMQAELVLPQPKPVPKVQPVPVVKPVGKPRKAKPQQTPPLMAEPSQEVQAQATEPVTEHAPITDQDNQAANANANANQSQQDVADVSELEPEVEMPPAPHYVAMEYDLSRGESSSAIGTTRATYESREDGSYKLRSETEAKGLASLFFSSKLIQTSTGVVTKAGLQPKHFSYEFGSNADKYQQADFDWEGGRLTMHTSKGDKTVPLPPGTQDLLSFMYQYMFVAPLQQMVISVTNGKKLSQYGYSFEGESTLVTKLGNLQTVHIAKSSGEGEEKTELWLATEYHYLPVKISKREKDGKQYEQIVTRISVE